MGRLYKKWSLFYIPIISYPRISANRTYEKAFFPEVGRTCPWTCKGPDSDFSQKALPGRLVIGRSYEAKRVLANAGWYFYDHFHFTYFAGWTQVDIDTGEF